MRRRILIWPVHGSYLNSLGHIELDWSEHGGPPVGAPRNDGFGTRLISKVLASQIGEVELSFPESGVRCRMRFRAG